MSNAKVNEIIPQHQTLEALKNHPNSENILEFLQDVLDTETPSGTFRINAHKKDFYQSLCYWLCESFSEHVIEALVKDPQVITEACNHDGFVKELITNFDDFKEPLLEDKYAVETIASEDKVIALVEENRGMESITSEELICELIQRYHTHDLDIKHWLSDIQLNNPKALLPRK